MRDLDLDYWRKPLQEARALHKKIEKLPKGKERDKLIRRHKALLQEARERLNEIRGNLTEENAKESNEL
jgi:AmiR/NasT family two-component response regulator